jgi:hypothetical protein
MNRSALNPSGNTIGRIEIQLASESLHATTHVIVENQVALADTIAARAVLLRLMAVGLDRHEAIHAIGWVLPQQLFAALRDEGGPIQCAVSGETQSPDR